MADLCPIRIVRGVHVQRNSVITAPHHLREELESHSNLLRSRLIDFDTPDGSTLRSCLFLTIWTLVLLRCDPFT
jgi:hypothetical protein